MRCYACKVGAIIERVVSNSCYAVWYFYACKAATPEHAVSNCCYTVRDYYACKVGAIIERVVSNSCYAVWYFYACNVDAMTERILSNTCYAVGYCNACKSGAITERTFSNICYAAGDFYACKAATPERVISNCCYAVRDYCILATSYERVRCSLNNCIAVISAVVNRVVLVYCYICNVFAITEGCRSYRCYAVGDFYACKAAATTVFATSYYSIFCK